jgi:hypothetical protein
LLLLNECVGFKKLSNARRNLHEIAATDTQQNSLNRILFALFLKDLQMPQTFITTLADEIAHLKNRLAIATDEHQAHTNHQNIEKLNATAFGRTYIETPFFGDTRVPGLRMDIRHLERLEAADIDLESAKLFEAKATRLDEKTAKQRAKLQTELQDATADQVQAKAALATAEASLRDGQASAYRGKAIDLQVLESSYSSSVDRVAILGSAIAAIEREVSTLPASTLKQAREALHQAARTAKDRAQWSLDRAAAIAVKIAADNLGEGTNLYVRQGNLDRHLIAIWSQTKAARPNATEQTIANDDSVIKTDLNDQSDRVDTGKQATAAITDPPNDSGAKLQSSDETTEILTA